MRLLQTTGRRRGVLAAVTAGLAATIAFGSPAWAADTVVGAGNMVTNISYTAGSIPGLLNCTGGSSWTMSGAQVNNVEESGGYIDLAGVDYAGPMFFSGTATGANDCGWNGSASLALTVSDGGQGIVNTNTISCNLNGTWIRTGVISEIGMVLGTCLVNNVKRVPNAEFTSAGVFQMSGGVLGPASGGTYTGPWAVFAAG